MEMKSLLRSNWDRALAIGLVIAGVVMLILGWFGVSGTGLAAEQNPYLISAGLGGIAVIAIGCTLWMSSDLQDEWRRLDGLEERLVPMVSAALQASSKPAATTSRSRASSNGARSTTTKRARQVPEPDEDKAGKSRWT